MWPHDVRSDLNAQEIHEYFQLWELVSTVELRGYVEDQVRCAWESTGQYTTRSAYACRFFGREHDLAATLIWQSRATLRCKFFAWLAMKNMCWTSDRLARRGLPHQVVCPLCDQEHETINHILVSGVFTRSVWDSIMEAWGKVDWTPSPNDTLLPWSAPLMPPAHGQKDLHTLLLLVVWQLWKH